ncbi:hypothetical protein HD554DRAFT_2024393 [Boletus coccyginus]|nr:hypothetical protein HD554DRAFT_2024393 [Boletus coccyginus]
MALHYHSAIKTDYPPPQKKRPLQPLPSPPSSCPSTECTAPATCGRRRSGTFSAIASWAAHVQPGSPATLSPRSPHRRPFLRKSRCPSTASIRTASASFLHNTPTPTTAYVATPSPRDFKADLTTVGYTSVFLQLPNSPVSACLSLSIKPSSQNAAKSIPFPPVTFPTCKPHGFSRLRSLSVLRPRSRSESARPDSSTKMKAKVAAASAAIVKRKKAKYVIRPPPLANELALVQLTDGGNMDTNAKRIMEAQAKTTGAVGLTDVYRDGAGGIWWDQDEEWEYTHLLAEGDESCLHSTGDLRWVTFGGSTSPSAAGVPSEGRRGSVSTQDSDLDPKYVVRPAYLLDGDDVALFGGAAPSLTTRKPSVSVLSLPSRPRRAAQHLRKPDFLVDMPFSRPHTTFSNSPKSPTMSGVGPGIVKPKGKARRRPVPLKLSPPTPAFKRPTNSPIDADKVRKDFIKASFKPENPIPATPATPATAVPVTTPVDVRGRLVGNNRAINVPWRAVNGSLASFGMKTKPSMLNMMGLF